jgi:hypothetical protein
MSIKTPKAPTMTDYKSAARASHVLKLKGLAGWGPVTQASFPIRPPVVAPLRSSTPTFGAKRPSIPGLAAGGNIEGRGHPDREMARMEKETKAAGNHRKPKKG